MNIPSIIIPTSIELINPITSQISNEVSKAIDYIPKEGKSYILINDKEKLLADINMPILVE